MYKTVIADSSCLIALSKIGQLAVLQHLFGRISIPPAVYHEVVIRGSGRPGAEEVAKAEWIETCPIKDRLAVSTLNLTLGIGESEAIVLASEFSADFLILDDWQARQAAPGLSLPVVGTVAILGKAVEKGLLPDLPSTLESLRRAGFRFLLPSAED
jgi:predicted nucleic acid-binding protein